MARLAEQAERYEDMVEYMKRVAGMGAELNSDERGLFSVAYKNSVGARRQAWRAVNTLEQREAVKGPAVLELIRTYRSKVEKELNTKCRDVIEVLDRDLITKASRPEAKVFYLKLKGDYNRYLAEFATVEGHGRLAQEAHDSYKSASEIAIAELPPTHPTRLGLALNFSVFYYEVYSSPETACVLAKSAFDDAMSVMDNLDEEEFKDSAQIMQLLRDNLSLWTCNMQQDTVEGGKLEQDGTTYEDFS
mmetsp:Transcript_60505/g.180199  ORF Transcript_60505/g.180199 Transcript_60505/m.180199 type:complete len:247 (-) Transcript_60505:76-816(-)